MFVCDAGPDVETGGVLLVLLTLLLLLLIGVAFTDTISFLSVRIEEFGTAAVPIGGLNDVYKLD